MRILNFYQQRKRIARKLNNPRMNTENRLAHVPPLEAVLGHKEIKSTMVYVYIEDALFQSNSGEFHVKTAKTIEEAAKLIEVGFEFVHEHNGIMIFRKRK
jgi:hypothetical protein